MITTPLVEGQRYRVRYRLDNQRRDRVFVGTYLGQGLSGLDFNLRPTAGTSSLPQDAIIGVQPVGNDIPHAQPEIAPTNYSL